MGDLAPAAATDNHNNLGLSASMSLADLDLVAELVWEEGSKDHEKSGFVEYNVKLSKSLNDFNLTLSLDSGMPLGVELSYNLGALALYGSYNASEGGGQVGAKLSF